MNTYSWEQMENFELTDEQLSAFTARCAKRSGTAPPAHYDALRAAHYVAHDAAERAGQNEAKKADWNRPTDNWSEAQLKGWFSAYQQERLSQLEFLRKLAA